MPSKTEQLKAGLVACGWKLDPNAKSSKYNVYIKDGVDYKYLVGRSGALRKTKGSVAASRSLSGNVKFLDAYRAVGSSKTPYASPEAAVAHLNDIYLASIQT